MTELTYSQRIDYERPECDMQVKLMQGVWRDTVDGTEWTMPEFLVRIPYSVDLVRKANVIDYTPPVPEYGYRFLDHAEMPKGGDEVWNFHFGQWCEYREIVDAAVDEYEKQQAPLRYVNPLVMSPRLSIIRRKL